MTATSSPSARDRLPVDFGALFVVSLLILPLTFADMIYDFASSLFDEEPLSSFYANSQMVQDNVLYAFGIVSATLALAFVWNGSRREATRGSYWSASIVLAIFTTTIVFLSTLFSIMREPATPIGLDESPSWTAYWLNTIAYEIVVAGAFLLAARVYIFRAKLRDGRDTDRLRALFIGALLTSLPFVVTSVVSYIDQVAQSASGPGFPIIVITAVHWAIAELILGFGLAFVIGIPAIASLRAGSREKSLLAIFATSMLVAALCWSILHRLEISQYGTALVGQTALQHFWDVNKLSLIYTLAAGVLMAFLYAQLVDPENLKAKLQELRTPPPEKT